MQFTPIKDLENFFTKNNYEFFSRFSDTDAKIVLSSRIEPSTQDAKYGRALSFEVYDPLWILARQWQYGRFKGNDCGSIVTAKIRTEKKRLKTVKYGNGEERKFSAEAPLEYEVEKRDRRITPYIRIVSAVHLTKKIKRNFAENADEIIALFCDNYPLADFSKSSEGGIEEIKVEQNTELKRLYSVYGKRIFDGYDALWGIVSGGFKNILKSKGMYSDDMQKVANAYREWFYRKYFPLSSAGRVNGNGCWSDEKLGYEVAVGTCDGSYCAEDYDSGKLSWYSFDGENMEEAFDSGLEFQFPINKGHDSEEQISTSYIKKDREKSETIKISSGRMRRSRISQKHFIMGEIVGGEMLERTENKIFKKDNPDAEIKMLSYLPVVADFPGAPSHRLWQCEGHNVRFGNETDFSFMANAVIMQYTSMYNHDWFLTPLEVEAGCVVDVTGIIVTDTFGERIFINKSAERNDNYAKEIRFDDRWALFSTSRMEAWNNNNFTSCDGLLIAPTVLRNEESKPLEEVQFLRDEMANMLWGVETVIDNGCGGTWDGQEMSTAVLASIDEQNTKSDRVPADECEYSYVLQNRVPLNWIPFIPRHIKGQAREIRFQRGRMPMFLNGKYESVRPSTSLLEARHDFDENIIPRFINEEEITGYGVKLVNTAQRTRWFLGETFNWTGYKTFISNTQANSGLMFDELIDVETEKRVNSSRRK